MRPTADRGVAEFIATLFDPGDLIEVRVLRPGKAASEFAKGCEFESPQSGIRAVIERLRGEQYNVYVGANPRKRAGGKASDVALARCLFVDMDGTTPAQADIAWRRAGLPEPTLIVATGHGVHLWWRLEVPITDLAGWSGYQRALIAVLESDPVIHDAPRIMRLPGTTNWKDEPPVPCEIVGGSGKRVGLGEMKLTRVKVDATRINAEPSAPGEWRHNLSRKTLGFVQFGAAEGERNARLFAAACDMAGNGATAQEARDLLGPKALQCGLPAEEIEASIYSAFGQARQAAVPPPVPVDAPMTAMDAQAKPRSIPNESPNTPQSTPEPKPEPKRARPNLSNVSAITVTNKDGERETRYVYKPIEHLAAELGEATGQWPRTFNKLIFTAKPSSLPIPGMSAVWTLQNTEALGAWLHSVVDIHWYRGRKAVTDSAGHEGKTPVTKAELFEYLRDNAARSYRGIAALPHHPPMDDLYYVPCKLPEPTGKHLKEIIDHLNPDSDEDLALMIAAILTPGWGGPCGGRPLFLISSTHGKGVGKTATASLIGEHIWGGMVTIKKDETNEKIVGRLLGDAGMQTRVVLMDNLKGMFGGQFLEAMLTQPTIDGWRPHVGQFTRPNDLTYIATMNSPRVTSDLATRSVEIRIGKRRHKESFVEWSYRYCRENRPAIIADIMAMLQGPPLASIPDGLHDRWQAWANGVLSRVPRGMDALRDVQERRKSMDADLEAAERIARVIENRRGTRTKIGNAELRDWLVDAKECKPNLETKQVTSWVKSLIGDEGPLAPLKPRKSKNDRFWVWEADAEPPATDADPLIGESGLI